MSADYWISIWTDGGVPLFNNWNYPWGYIIVYVGLGIVQAIINFFK